MSKYSELLDQVRKQHEETKHMNLNDRVMIVDGLNSYIRCFAAVPTMNDDGEHVGGIAGFLKTIGYAARTIRPTRIIIVFDGKGGSQRRRKIFSDYKENRKSQNRLNRTYGFDDLDHEKESMKWQLLALAELLTFLPITVLAPNHVEADDVIAYIADIITQRGGESYIMSTDKDFLQIVSDSVTIWNPVKKKMYSTSDVTEEYQIHPNNFAIYRAVDGDKSDNIPGIKGIGPKSLIKYFPQLTEPERVELDELLRFSDEKKKGKTFEKIVNNIDTIRRNYMLMRLDEVQMSGNTKSEVLQRFDNDEISFDKRSLTERLAQHKMLGVFGNYDQWLLTTFQPLVRFTSND